MGLQWCLHFNKILTNCPPFTTCITKNPWKTIDDAWDFDLVLAIFNLTEHSSNHFETSASLGSYSKDKATNFNIEIVNTDDFKSFSYTAKLLGKSEADNSNGILKNATVTVPLKYLSNFCRSLECH